VSKHLSKKQRREKARAKNASRNVAISMLKEEPSSSNKSELKVPEKLHDWLQEKQDKIDDDNEFDSIAESIRSQHKQQKEELKQGHHSWAKEHRFVIPKKMLSPIQEGGKSNRHKSKSRKSIKNKSIKNKSKKYRK
jgi:hypothetical protein